MEVHMYAEQGERFADTIVAGGFTWCGVMDRGQGQKSTEAKWTAPAESGHSSVACCRSACPPDATGHFPARPQTCSPKHIHSTLLLFKARSTHLPSAAHFTHALSKARSTHPLFKALKGLDPRLS
eukprot:364696-Chlamydomonas_euryale.AAC.16